MTYSTQKIILRSNSCVPRQDESKFKWLTFQALGFGDSNELVCKPRSQRSNSNYLYELINNDYHLLDHTLAQLRQMSSNHLIQHIQELYKQIEV